MKPIKELTGAAARGDLNTMRAVLKADRALVEEWKPLMDACFAGQADAVKLLLDHGAKINQTDGEGRTPLARARERKRKKAVDFLAARGAEG